jgi:hypothetical protein
MAARVRLRGLAALVMLAVRRGRLLGRASMPLSAKTDGSRSNLSADSDIDAVPPGRAFRFELHNGFELQQCGPQELSDVIPRPAASEGDWICGGVTMSRFSPRSRLSLR